MKKQMKTDAELLCEALLKIEKQQAEIAHLNSQLDWFRRQTFGSKSEKIHTPIPEQTVLNLFGEPVEIPGLENPEEKTISTDPIESKEPSKKKGRKPFADGLPCEEIVILPSESELTCSCCGKSMVEIGREENKTLEYIPAHFKVINYVRPKYACRCGEGGFAIAETPSRPIEKSIAESSLLAHVAVCKYVDHLPLYRQSQIFARYAIEIARSTMSDWIGKMYDLLTPIYERMRISLLESGYIQMDETTIKVLKDPGVGKSTKKVHLGYYWPFTDGNQVLFEYDPGRDKFVPMDILKEYHGYLQTDGFDSYKAIVLKNGITWLACWAHVRRRFFEAKEYDENAKIFLAEIGKLYETERKAEEVCKSFEERAVFRQTHARLVLDRIKHLLDYHAPRVLPKSPFGRAVLYARNMWEKLTVYLEDGQLRIDNNRIENLIRPVALGRKNWLFAGSPEGARRAALFYSIFGSCRIRGINPFEYLKDVLDRINDTKISDIDQLLPMNWKPQSRV
jgi:transposase